MVPNKRLSHLPVGLRGFAVTKRLKLPFDCIIRAARESHMHWEENFVSENILLTGIFEHCTSAERFLFDAQVRNLSKVYYTAKVQNTQ